ncbi:MAG: Pyruvate kinase, alpha/beta domain [Syntrophorhabdus sp. PtaU1.Bin153]|nr:MAG: Pyruvate kinase, alpha/beta domain [Syntrophorhabdus sp. PtaU1.Bin153]
MYFQKPGIENTDKTIEAAFQYAAGNNIKDIIIASTTGYCAEKMLAVPNRDALNIVVVTHNTGFAAEGAQSFPADLRNKLVENGIKVHTGTMVLRSLGTAIRELSGGYSEQELIANTLRMFSQGVKVCVEIVAMAADGGLIPFSDVIAVAGTGRGADTACLIKANSSNRFFNIKVKEIIAKPKEV